MERNRILIGMPESGECSAYFRRFLDLVDDPDLLGFLVAQQVKMREFLAALPEAKGSFRYAPGKWTVKQVIGHLADTERVFSYRALSFARADTQPLPGFEEVPWVAASNFDSRSVASLTAGLDAVRTSTLELFEHFDEAAWRRTGVADGVTFSVRALGYFVAAHVEHHRGILEDRYLVMTQDPAA